MDKVYDVIVIGAGAAGIGMGITLREFGINNLLIVDKGEVGDSFKHWPQETRFITPSFTTNGFGMPDINSVSIDTSPAYTFEQERFSGKDYAQYLELIAEEYELPVEEHQLIQRVEKSDNGYKVISENKTYITKYVIFAVGEFNFPSDSGITGAKEHGIHYSEVQSWDDFKDDDYIVIGGNESSIDAATNLLNRRKKVTLITSSTGMNSDNPDPSISLAPYTRTRHRQALDHLEHNEQFKVVQARVKEITHKDNYSVITENNNRYESNNKVILGTGFNNGALNLAKHLFVEDDNGQADLTKYDESTIADNAFLVGPSVRHGQAIFCYVYKFRQRFAIIAEEIARREQLDVAAVVDRYKKHSFYLDDCLSCEVICDC